MSDLDTRLAQLVRSEQQASTLTEAEVDAGWTHLSRTLAEPLPPGPPDGSGDGANVVPLPSPRAPVRVGVWIWPAAAVVAIGLAVAWRASVATNPHDEGPGKSRLAPPIAAGTAPAVIATSDAAAGETTAPSVSAGVVPGDDDLDDTHVLEPPETPTAPTRPEAAPIRAPTPAPSDTPSRRTKQAEPTRETSASPKPGLVEELALLEQMRSALAKDDDRRVLTLGKQHRKDFPQGALREERAALEVRASCRLGRSDAASRRATFVEAWPTSAHVERIDRDCTRAQ